MGRWGRILQRSNSSVQNLAQDALKIDTPTHLSMDIVHS